jgi:hypothetical protein
VASASSAGRDASTAAGTAAARNAQPGTASSGSTGAVQSGAPSVAAEPAPGLINAAPGRRGLLNSIGRSPTQAEIDAAPGTYGVVVLNQWDGALAARLKQRDPSVVVLMYQCLASTRTFDSTTNRAGGVLYSAASPSWFALDTSGRRIGWGPYSGHYQMAVWDAGYQQAWVDNVTRSVGSGPWDGVLADNDMSTLRWYTSALFAGSPTRDATDARLRRGLQTLVDRAGAALNARGKLLVPNISDSRLFPGRWAAHARYGGGMEESFVHFGESTTEGWVGDWGADGWMAQTDQMRTSGLSLAITRAQPGDRRTLLYGFTSMLVRGDADSYWMPSTEADAGYRMLASIPEMTWLLGSAGEPRRESSGAWTRQYQAAWVAVNPTARSVSVRPPNGARTADGAPAAVQQLGPYTGVLLKLG